MTSASLLSARFRGIGDFDQGNRVENVSWDRAAPSQEACTGGEKNETHHHGFSQRAVSRNLTLLSDTLCTVSLDEPLSNRVFADTDETPDIAGTSTLTSRNQRQKQDLHDAGSQRRICRGMLCEEVRHRLCC